MAQLVTREQIIEELVRRLETVNHNVRVIEGELPPSKARYPIIHFDVLPEQSELGQTGIGIEFRALPIHIIYRDKKRTDEYYAVTGRRKLAELERAIFIDDKFSLLALRYYQLMNDILPSSIDGVFEVHLTIQIEYAAEFRGIRG